MLKSEISTELCRFLSDMEEELGEANKQAIHRRYITSVVIRITMVLMIVLTIANGFLLDMLSTGLSESLSSAEIMSDEFGDIQHNMAAITRSVRGIDHEMQALTYFATDISTVNHNMGMITHEMHTVANAIGGIEGSVHQVGNSMSYVDQTIRDVSTDMYYIGDDVNRMTKPVKWMNKVLPW